MGRRLPGEHHLGPDVAVLAARARRRPGGARRSATAVRPPRRDGLRRGAGLRRRRPVGVPGRGVAHRAAAAGHRGPPEPLRRGRGPGRGDERRTPEPAGPRRRAGGPAPRGGAGRPGCPAGRDLRRRRARGGAPGGRRADDARALRGAGGRSRCSPPATDRRRPARATPCPSDDAGHLGGDAADRAAGPPRPLRRHRRALLRPAALRPRLQRLGPDHGAGAGCGARSGASTRAGPCRWRPRRGS